MKNFAKLFSTTQSIAIIAFVAIIGFCTVSCETGDNNNNDNSGDTFSISGKIAKGDGSDAQFNLSRTANSGRSVARSAGLVYDMAGALNDGDITFRLNGTFDSDTGRYSASAASSNIRYTISGSFDNGGNSLGATATLAVKTETDEWKAFSVPVLEDNTVTVSGTPQDSNVEGLPQAIQGRWLSVSGTMEDFTFEELRAVVSPFRITVDTTGFTESGGGSSDPGNPEDPVPEPTDPEMYYDQMDFTVIEVTQNDDSTDAVVAYPVYRPTKDEVIAVVKDYLQSKGVSNADVFWYTGDAEYQTWYTDNTVDEVTNDGKPYVFLRIFGDELDTDNFTFDASGNLPNNGNDIFNEWHGSTVHVRIANYLMKQPEREPEQSFGKMRFTQTGDSFTLTLFGKTPTGQSDPETWFDTFAEAKALTAVIDQFSYTFTRTGQ